MKAIKATWTLLGALVVLGTSSAALADGPSGGPVYTTRVVDVVGRRVVPIAAVEVTRALPNLKLRDLVPGFALGIEASVAGKPF